MMIDKLIGGGTATKRDGTEVKIEVLISDSMRGDDKIQAEIYEDDYTNQWEFFDEDTDYDDILEWANELYDYAITYTYFEEDEAE